jgi:hypothetical protein
MEGMDPLTMRRHMMSCFVLFCVLHAMGARGPEKDATLLPDLKVVFFFKFPALPVNNSS